MSQTDQSEARVGPRLPLLLPSPPNPRTAAVAVAKVARRSRRHRALAAMEASKKAVETRNARRQTNER